MNKKGVKVLLGLSMGMAILFVILRLFLFGEDGIKPPSFHKLRPSLTFYPLDTHIQFIDARTHVSLENRSRERHSLEVNVFSQTSSASAIRQDISLVFANGVLINQLMGGKENTSFIKQSLITKGEGSIRYDIISFHYAEIHQQQGAKTSQFTMSEDRVYLLSSAFTSSSLFRQAQTNTQKHWKRILDNAIHQNWNYQWNHLIQHFGISDQEYDLIPLYQLQEHLNDPIEGFSRNETLTMIGKVWECLFEHFLHRDGRYTKEQELKGSMMPLVLISKEKDHFRILDRTQDGEEFQVIEMLD